MKAADLDYSPNGLKDNKIFENFGFALPGCCITAGAERALAEAIAKTVRDGQGELATKVDIIAVDSRISALHDRIGTLQWVVGIQSAITLATFAIVAAKLL